MNLLIASDKDRERARMVGRMFDLQRKDTKQIAFEMGLREAEVYNLLAAWRDWCFVTSKRMPQKVPA